MAGSAKTALVTGAASGIGAATARVLAEHGAHVLCVDRDGSGLDEVVDSITSAGGSATAVMLDLVDTTAVTAWLSSGRLGPALDQVALCAGIYLPTPTEHFDLAEYRRVLDVNLTGALHLLIGLIPQLRASAAPRVVTISSIQAAFAEVGSLGYSVSKAGLVAATRSLAVDLAPQGILVNSIAPGFIDTPMAQLADGTSEHDTDAFRTHYVEAGKLPLGRPGTAHEIATAAAFLLGPENTYITGHVLVVDGGLTATF